MFVLDLFLLSTFLSCILGQEVCYQDYPLQYIAYKLQPGEKIVFDGKLDDPAWNVDWTSKFVDIQGKGHKPPYYDTFAKMRYDDDFLYLGGLIYDPNAWANLTKNNSIIFVDNDFEVFIDPNGDNHYYKELELNARNVNWNLILCRPYLNGGPPVCNATIPPGGCALSAPQFGVPYWDIAPYLRSATYVNGVLNDPRKGTKYWSIEIGIPIREYLRYEGRGDRVHDGEYWRLDFSRVEWHIKTVHLPDGQVVYWKIPNVPEENWVWSPMGAINMHMPEYWGYVQFSDINSTKLKRDEEWPVRSALMQVYYAETNLYNAKKIYTTSLDLLEQYGLPANVTQGLCSHKPKIFLDPHYGFIATAKHKHHDHIEGHVRSDRLLWFTK